MRPRCRTESPSLSAGAVSSTSPGRDDKSVRPWRAGCHIGTDRPCRPSRSVQGKCAMELPMPATAPLEHNVALNVERRLVGIAQSFDAALRDRVTLLLMAAAEAIGQLADLDLVRFEGGQEQGAHTLALWEEMRSEERRVGKEGGTVW